MKKILATGFADYLEDDTPALYVSHGKGNSEYVGDQVHLEVHDPATDTRIPGWFPRTQLLEAILGREVFLRVGFQLMNELVDHLQLTEPEHHMEPTA